MEVDQCPECGSKDIDMDGAELKEQIKTELCFCEDCGCKFEVVWAFMATKVVS